MLNGVSQFVSYVTTIGLLLPFSLFMVLTSPPSANHPRARRSCGRKVKNDSCEIKYVLCT